jgi:methyl-accepting chemotaxis protein
MRPFGSLLRNSAAAILLSQLVVWWMATTVLPLTPEQHQTFRWIHPATAAGMVVLVLVAIALACRPLRRAASAPGAPDAEAAGRRAALAAHRLPAAAASAAILAGVLATVTRAAVMRGAGTPGDVALAGAGVGVAAAILGGMAVYALCVSAAARALDALGPRLEVAARGTVRGKILVVGFGLNTIGLLLFAATGYSRYRADIDREYVASGLRAQQSALAAGGRLGDAELAEHVWLVTASPTALLEPDGTVAARHGGGDRSLGELATAPGVLRTADGWVVATRAPGGGLVASWMPEAPLRERRRAFWASLASTGLLVYLAGAVLAWMAARAITNPFRSLGLAADRIASGDLTASPPSVSQDEMGRLAADFRRMAQGLKGLVIDVQAASLGVSDGAREAGAIGERVRLGATGQHHGVVAVQGAVEAMEDSVAQVARGVGALSEYVSATTAAVGEMAAGLEEVRRKGAELDRAMDSALADVENLAGAGREAESTLGDLEGLASHAGGTLAGVRASVSALERAAGESEANAALVAEMAERSGGVVEETVHGIETLRAAVSDAHRRINILGRRSDDIDQVVDFISEVAGRTNLLSLNASIIAAQAGEHGKAFAVVADQIRDLAAQIARSTKSIGDIIHSVREDVEATAALIDRGDALAVEGVQLARNSLEALGQIQRTTAQGRETAGAIRAAVDAHASSSRDVSLLVESVANGSRAVTAAVQLVGRSVAGVGSVSRSVNALAEQISRALEEQAGLGRRQMESLSRLDRMISDITRAVESHNAATRRVRETLGQLSHATGDHEVAVDGLSGVADRLGSRARALAERIDRFKV